MLFPADFLTRVEYLSIMSRRVFRGSLLASRRTTQLGSGVEFSDHREYTPGDDFRYLDWNVYARHGELLLKRFQEEQDLHVYLLLDCSKSMGFGGSDKFDLARRLTAALAYIALADLDRICVVAAAGDVVADFPLTRGKARILPLMRFLENLECDGAETDLRRSADTLVRSARKAGLAVVLSDLFDPSGFSGGLDRLRHRKFDLHVVQLHDRREADPALLGDAELVDIETAEARKVTVTEAAARRYKELFAAHQQAVRDYCRNYGCGCTQSTSDVAYDSLVMQMMRLSARV